MVMVRKASAAVEKTAAAIVRLLRHGSLYVSSLLTRINAQASWQQELAHIDTEIAAKVDAAAKTLQIEHLLQRRQTNWR